MILTFKEIGIDASDYNGYSFAATHSLIVNQTCDYVMDSLRNTLYDMLYGPPDESYHIPYPERATVDMVQHTVNIFVQP